MYGIEAINIMFNTTSYLSTDSNLEGAKWLYSVKGAVGFKLYQQKRASVKVGYLLM